MERPAPTDIALALLAGLSIASFPAEAMESPLNLLPLSLEELIATPVITASRRSESREQTPAHIVVITREQMRDRRYRNLADLIADLPGVDFQAGTRSSAFNNFVFQGHAGNNKLLILLDGVRIDHPAGGKIPVADNFSLHLAKQVEVLYGPAAALYGADALGGVINIITDKAEAGDNRVAGSIGSFGSLDGNFQVSGKVSDTLALTAGAHYQESDRAPLDKYYPDSYPKVAAGGVPANQRESYVGNISSQSQYFRADAGEQLTFGFYRNRFRSLTSNGDKTATSFYRRDTYFDTTLDTLYGKFRADITPTLSSETVLDYSTFEVSPDSRYINLYTQFQNNGYEYTHARRLSIEQNFNWQASERDVIQSGLGFRDYTATESPDLPHPYNTSLAPSNQGMTYTNTNLPLQIFDTRYHSWFGYLQWQAQWNDDFSTMAGLRQDWYSTYGSTLNPRLGAVWRTSPGNYLKLLYGHAFRAPTPEETYSAFGSFDGSRDASGNYIGKSSFRAPNTSLQPEKSKTLSLTWDWRPRLDFNLVSNVYLTDVTKIIVTRDDATPTQYIPGAVLQKTTSKQNGGNDSYRGIDLIPQWRVHLGGAWSADLWGSYSHIRGKTRTIDDSTTWDEANIAGNKLKLGTTFRYQDWLTITPRLQWIGKTTTGQPTEVVAGSSLQPGERLTTDAYTVASLHLGMHKLAGERLSLYLDIDNLFDARYYAAHGSSSGTLLQVPQQPRTVMGSLEYRF